MTTPWWPWWPWTKSWILANIIDTWLNTIKKWWCRFFVCFFFLYIATGSAIWKYSSRACVCVWTKPNFWPMCVNVPAAPLAGESLPKANVLMVQRQNAALIPDLFLLLLPSSFFFFASESLDRDAWCDMLTNHQSTATYTRHHIRQTSPSAHAVHANWGRRRKRKSRVQHSICCCRRREPVFFFIFPSLLWMCVK